MAKGGKLEDDVLYVGRGGRGVPPSKWGNPFKIGKDGTRAEVLRLFRVHFQEKNMAKDLGELAGKDLLCHCGPGEACHADYLCAMVNHCVPQAASSMTEFADDGLPVRIKEPLMTEPPHEVPVVVAGWRGSGPSRSARHIGGDRPFCDGGGLCSPGRWTSEKRRLPSCMAGLKESMGSLFEEAVRRASNGKDDPLGFMLKLAAGRVKACPFEEGALAEARASIRQLAGMDEKEDVVASGQVFHLKLIGRLLKMYDDPDWEFVDSMGEGVPLGVDMQLPRTPAVFEEKGKWKLPDDAGPGVDTCEKYRSVDPHLEKVKALFREEATLGWMEELPEDVARARCGTRLAIAA